MSAKTLVLKDVKVGDKLPELVLPLTTTLIVGGALASLGITPRFTTTRGWPSPRVCRTCS